MGTRGRTKFDKNENVYFVTTTVMNFDKIFSLSDNYSNILIESLKYLNKEHNTIILAYVIMPSHIHLIIQFPEGESLIDYMRDFKKFTSTKIRQQLELDGQLDVLDKLRINAVRSKNQVFKLWMDKFDDFVITNDKMFYIKMNYIHNNPVKAGLVQEITNWKYSSARNYLLNDNSIIEIGFKD